MCWPTSPQSSSEGLVAISWLVRSVETEQTHKRTCRIIEEGCLKGTQFSLITSLNLKMMNNDLMIKGHEPYWARGVRGMTSLFSDRLKRPLGAFPSKCCQVTVDLTKTADLHSSNGASMMSDIELNNKIPAKVSFGHVETFKKNIVFKSCRSAVKKCPFQQT